MLSFDNYFHVYNHANGFDNLFLEERNYYYFLIKYEEHISPIAELITHCLMPNHFHFLVKIKSEEVIYNNFPILKKLHDPHDKALFLSKIFANFFSSYAQAFNKVYERKGSLFRKSFKNKIIHDDIALKNVILYLHLNPVHHGFTSRFAEYKHSGFHEFQDKNQALTQRLFGNSLSFMIEHIEKAQKYELFEKMEEEYVY